MASRGQIFAPLFRTPARSLRHATIKALDEPVLRWSAELLGRESAGVVEGVAAALARIEAGGIDAAIVDVHLANGQTGEAIAAALAAANIPFLVATGGFVGRVDAVWTERPILTKPFKLDTLEAGLKSISV